MGVIVQPMIEAKYAGVCFSRHPSFANVFENNRLVIEFASTSSEQIGQGEITPFRLVGTDVATEKFKEGVRLRIDFDRDEIEEV